MKNNSVFFALFLANFFSFNAEGFYRYPDKPSDPNVTPTTPQRIEHWYGLVGGRAFSRRRIYFDGSYKSIAEHAAENPEFGNVTLAIFHKATWYNLRNADTFEIAGVYSNKNARKYLIGTMTPYMWEDAHRDRGAQWCPGLEPKEGVFIAGDGTIDPTICDRFAQYVQEKQSEQSKVKKQLPFGLYGIFSSTFSTNESKSEEKSSK